MRAVLIIVTVATSALSGCAKFAQALQDAEARRQAAAAASPSPPREEMGYQMVQSGDNFVWVRTPASGSSAYGLCDAAIIADDGTYLGKVASEYDHESIANEYGNHGSPYGAESMFNEYGRYGGQYSNLSPFNEYTNTPPRIVAGGQIVGLVTVNKYLANGVHPLHLRNWAKKNCP